MNYQHHPHEAPQVSYSDAPEAVYYKDEAGLEVAYGNSPEVAGQSSKERRILGLRPRIFWGIAVLAVIIVAAAIGGGVGGSMAAKKSSSSSSADVSSALDSSSNSSAVSDTNNILPSSNTSSNTPSATNPTSSSATTTPSTASSLPSSSGTFISSSVTTAASSLPSAIRGYTGCPGANGTIYSSQRGSKFQILCDKLWSWGGNDLDNPATANLELCMEQCALWNAAYAPNSTCYLAVFGKQYTATGYRNCWLKSVPLGGDFKIIDDVTVAAGMTLNV